MNNALGSPRFIPRATKRATIAAGTVIAQPLYVKRMRAFIFET
jgi:hypothetical protein